MTADGTAGELLIELDLDPAIVGRSIYVQGILVDPNPRGGPRIALGGVKTCVCGARSAPGLIACALEQ